MTALALSLLLLHRPAQAAQGQFPTIPLGTSEEFARAAMAVEAKLVEGDVPGARIAARALPVRNPRLVWADADLSEALRAKRAAGLDAVVSRFGAYAKGFAPKADAGEPDLTVGFAKALPDGPDGIPLAATVAVGPPFRATIGLTRGKPGVPLRPEEMNQELAFALGRYLGVPESPALEGTSMHVDARPGLQTFFPHREELILAAQNLLVADQLRAAVEAGKPLGLAHPSVRLAKPTLALGDVDQGRPVRTTIDLENLGAGPLAYTVTPDCSCFSPMAPGIVPPQGRGKIEVRINTQTYTGPVDKILVFRSNDPDRPTIEIPVSFRARPAYRLFRPAGDKVVVPPTGGTYDFFLFTPPGSPLHVTSVGWNGMAAKVTWEPWSGPLADPQMGEGALPRTGWRFHVQVPKGLAAGRASGGLEIETDSPVFPTLTTPLFVQKGIVADDVNLGDVVAGSQASLIVDRPNAPFKILRVDAGPLKASWRARRGGWEYSVDLEYRGGTPKGDLAVPVRIHTDDPKQPVVESLAHGFVK